MRLVPFGFAAAIALAQAAHADPLLDRIGELPGAVEEMRVGGEWQQAEKKGVYRVAIARSATSDGVTPARLFIQWISRHNGEASVDNTLEIKEITSLKADIVDFSMASVPNGLSVNVETIDPEGNENKSYEIVVASPTDYKFSSTDELAK